MPKRKHIVFCWELGGGMGHLVPLSLVAAEMMKDGCKVTFVINDISNAAQYLSPYGVEWLQAPYIKYRPGRRPLINHADILLMVGYEHPDKFAGLLGAWRTSLACLKPDRIICEYAPTAQLAARSLGIPCVCIDNGFSMPPVSDPMPPLQLDQAADIGRLQSSEQVALQNINTAMRSFGAQPLTRFAELYECEVWYRNWVEFNHYGPHSPERHLGQIVGDTGGVEPSWPTGEGPKMFAYIKSDHPFAPEILKAAAEFGFRVLAYLPGRSDATLQDLRNTGRITISDAPVRLSSLDEDVKVGVWQSPTGGVCHSLEKGMRMLFLPSQAEQMLACRAVERAGVPAHISSKREDWRRVFEELLGTPNMLFGQRWMPADIPAMAQLLAAT